ncbi:MAG: glycosyltransferase family 9 protein [Candidatus Aenigmarchaeota archaeon]|nr:glycosyltransferase family 9 protein [Candidatus Aenigmarchaeota archaeon]
MIHLFRLIDKLVGSVLCVLLMFFRLPRKQSVPTKILVIKLWAVGESILTLPLIAELKKHYPNSSISVLCRNRNKAVYEGKVDSVILFEAPEILRLLSRYNAFDLIIDCEPYLNVSALLGWWLGNKTIGFAHGIRSMLYTSKVRYDDQQHVVQTYADMLSPLGIMFKPSKLEPVAYNKIDEERAEEILKKAGLRKTGIIVGMCQSVAESGKWRKWPAEQYSALADRIIEKFNAKIVLIGGKDTIQNNADIMNACEHKKSVINLGGKTSLKELFALTKHFNLFISNDTGPMHIAAAQGVPTIGLFGPNTPVRFAPFGKGNIALYKKTCCSPCINVHKGSFPECFNAEKGLCMKQITVQQVYAAIKNLPEFSASRFTQGKFKMVRS